MGTVFNGGDTVRIIGTVFGWINVLLCLLIYISNKRSRILLLKLSSDALSALNLIMCSFRVSGAIACLTAVFREILFCLRTKKKWADHICWLFVVIVALAFTAIADFAIRGAFNPLALLPAVGSMIAAVGLFSKNTLRMKILVFTGSVPYLFYNVFSYDSGKVTVSPNVPGIVSTALVLISTIIGTVHEISAKKKSDRDSHDADADI